MSKKSNNVPENKKNIKEFFSNLDSDSHNDSVISNDLQINKKGSVRNNKPTKIITKSKTKTSIDKRIKELENMDIGEKKEEKKSDRKLPDNLYKGISFASSMTYNKILSKNYYMKQGELYKQFKKHKKELDRNLSRILPESLFKKVSTTVDNPYLNLLSLSFDIYTTPCIYEIKKNLPKKEIIKEQKKQQLQKNTLDGLNVLRNLAESHINHKDSKNKKEGNEKSNEKNPFIIMSELRK